MPVPTSSPNRERDRQYPSCHKETCKWIRHLLTTLASATMNKSQTCKATTTKKAKATKISVDWCPLKPYIIQRFILSSTWNSHTQSCISPEQGSQQTQEPRGNQASRLLTSIIWMSISSMTSISLELPMSTTGLSSRSSNTGRLTSSLSASRSSWWIG